MTDELTLAILAEIAKPGSGQLFSRREAARHAIAMIEQQAGRIAAAEADAIERCAKVCNEVAEEFGPGDWKNASLQCSATIRALLTKEQS